MSDNAAYESDPHPIIRGMPDRHLTRTSVPPYTTTPFMAMNHEPAAVTQDEQDELTRRAHLTPLETQLHEAQHAHQHHAAMARHHERKARRLEQLLARGRHLT